MRGPVLFVAMWDRVRVVTLPTEVPVTLAEAKAWLDVTFGDDDDVIQALISAATARFDGPNGIGIACCTQTWSLDIGDKMPDRVVLPGWPVQSVSSVLYDDTTGLVQTASADLYHLRARGERDVLVLKDGAAWPGGETYVVTYTVGTAAADVPADIKTAIKQLVAHWYQNRMEGTEKALSMLPMGARYVLDAYRQNYVGA